MPYKKLSIPEPCRQKWSKMAPNGEGRHCQSCNTTIVDFSDLSDEELIQVLQSGKYHCGRFHEDQLGIMYYMDEKRKERKKYWNSIAAAIVAGVLQISSGFGQTDKQPQKQRLYPSSLAFEKYFKADSVSVTQPEKKENKETKKDIVTFVFLNEKHKTPIKAVQLNIKELSFSGTSNEEGEIVLNLNPKVNQQQIITVEVVGNMVTGKRGKRGYHGKTLFLELEKLVNDEKIIYLHVKVPHRRKHHGGTRWMGRFL